MAISFVGKMTWKQFWEQQNNNPYCELAFRYKEQVYFLYYKNDSEKVWRIYESGPDSNCRGEDAFGKIVSESYDEIQTHTSKPNDEQWQSMLDSCYKLLTKPIWNEKSFRDVIDEIDFES